MKKKYEVVISGIAGRFPESDNIEELKQNLYSKRNLITNDNRRWRKGPPLPEVPCSTGKINERDVMDMTYFGLHRRLCEVTDPHQRICMELSFAAILDAGINPNSLSGTNTAVVTNSVTSETEYECLMDIMNIGLAILGHSRSMQANRISYCLNLRGPSLMIDSSWNSGAESLAYAATLIERGDIDAAIVSSCSILYTAEVAYHYYRMGRLTQGDHTKSFSDDADGYNRSEAGTAFLLQRKDDALRSYGSPHFVSNYFNGSKDVAFSEISQEAVRWYLETYYSMSKIPPHLVSYVEAAGVASKAVDAAELNGMAQVMLPGREKPLLVGSVKSNLGHTEASACSVSIIKALIIADSGIILPNINYDKPNSLVPYLSSGEIQVVTEPTPLEGDYVGVNSISSTSGFAHVIIKRHEKVKERTPEKNVLPSDGLPRLFLLSGRNEIGTKEALQRVEERPIDEEYVTLANAVFKRGIKKHLYRGYTVLNDKEKVCNGTKPFFTGSQKMQPVWWVFTGMGSQWPGMGVELMKLPVFARAINNCHEILKHKGIDLIHIISTPDPKIYDNILHSFVGIAAIQIALVDVLKEIGLEPDGIVGHSVGELGCAYADGCFTAEQMILAAYARGKASIEADLIQGMMAAVGRGYKQIKDDLPDGIEVACHNSRDSCTLSGPTEMMKEYIEKLKSHGIFAKLVNVADIAYHSKYIRPAAPALLKYLKEVIPEPKPRSSKWVSSSVQEAEWDRESARYSSAEYHTNNLLGSVLFEEASAHIPKDAVILEIAPHGLLQAILKRSFPKAVHIPLTNRIDPNGLIFLFNALGKLYLEGAEFDIEKLYPPVEFPVSRGTPSLNDLVVWDHSELWRINVSTGLEDYDPLNAEETIKPRFIEVNIENDEFNYLTEYVIYNCVTIPLSFYLVNVIQDYQQFRNSKTETLKIQNIKTNNLIQVQKDCKLFLTLGKGTGCWEVSDGMNPVATGEISPMIFGLKEIGMPSLGTDISAEEVYSYLTHMGHELGPKFRLIKSATLSTSDVSAVIEWNGDLLAFLDSTFKVPALLSIGHNKLSLVSSMKTLKIDFSKFKDNKKKDVLVNYNSVTGMLLGEGIEILYPRSSSPHTKKPEYYVCSEKMYFVPYDGSSITAFSELLQLCIKILFNNMCDLGSPDISLSVIEVQDNLPIHDQLLDVLKWIREPEVRLKVASTDSSLAGVTDDQSKEYCFILTGSNELEYSIRILNSSQGGFILMKGQQPPSYLATIFKVTIEGEQYFFCRPKRILENPIIVRMNSEDWKEQLRTALQKSNGEIVYLLGLETSLSIINNTVYNCNKLENSYNLRFLFLDIDISGFNLDTYKYQLELDLRVNIFQDGKWGACLTHPIDFELEPTLSETSVYPFSDLRCERAVNPKVICLNLTDISSTIRKLQVCEYSGLSCREEVCGLANISEFSRTLQPDPIFQWRKPKNWTHEEISTVLMPYAMAYYIMNIAALFRSIMIFLKEEVTILVHQGHLPLSQAIINISSNANTKIFTTYNCLENKKRIMQLFPELPEENIINSEKQSYDIELLQLTNGEGFRVIVNTLPERESLKKSVSLIGKEGILYQVSLPILEEDEKMGMRVFLKQTAVEGINPASIMNINDSYKKEIQKFIQKGLDSGTIKPFPHIVIPSETLNIDAVSMICNNSCSDHKIVVQMDKKVRSKVESPFVCDVNGCYLILADEKGFWLDLAEWIVTRGANTIYIVVTKEMLAGVGTEKLHTLQIQNPHINIIITSEKRVSTPAAVDLFIKGINRMTTLDTVFIIGEVFKNGAESLVRVLSNEKLVVLSESSDILCENRIARGLPTLAASVDPNLLTSHGLIPVLDKLMKMSHPKVIITEKYINEKIVIDVERAAYTQHLPTTVNEIMGLVQTARVAEWREVKSSSPNLKACTELPPVFVIPSLKKGQLKSCLKSLFHPTFTAVIPEYFRDFEDLAVQLYQAIQRFNIGVFTIICSDWSWLIGLLIGQFLEADGKEVSLFFFESCIAWESPAAFHQVRSLVNKDLSTIAISDSQKENLRKKVEKGLSILKDRLDLFSRELPEVKQKIKGICHYMRSNITWKEERLEKIQRHCERPINVFKAENFDFLKMIDDPKLLRYINTYTLFEYKDAANRMEKLYLPNGCFENPRLSYMNFMQSLHQNKCQSHLTPDKLPEMPL